MDAETPILIEIAQTLDSPSDETARLSRSAELIRGLLRSTRCSLLFETGRAGRVVISAPVLQPGALELLQSRLSTLLDVGPGDVSASTSEGARLGLPLVGLDQVTGFLFIEREAPPYDYREIRLFSLVAAQLGGYLTILALHARAVELDRFKEEMFALVAHDLKNPLAAVTANLELVEMDLADGETKAAACLADAQRACRRIGRLIQNLLDMTRLEANRLPLAKSLVDLADLLPAVMKEREGHARARRATLLVEQLPGGLMGDVDPDVFRRVLENIFDNALRYTPSGGRVEVSAIRAEGRIQIRIGNTGVAIAPEDRKKIFEKFGQASASGRMNLGLGLYFGRLAMEAHGGSIWVESSQALPTIFVLDLPAGPEGSVPKGQAHD